jgi:hypothetical protein
MKNYHYFEAHVTIEPVFDERLDNFAEICSKYKFRVAELLMKKREEHQELRSKYDSFCTGRGVSYKDLELRMIELIKNLKQREYKVWRYKIESTLLDSKYKDDLKLLVKYD